MRKKTICNIIRIGSSTVTLAVLHLMYEIGVVGYVMVCLTAIAWSLAEHLECNKEKCDL